MIEVIVVHQTRLIANLIANLLQEQPDIVVVATAVSPAEALEKIDQKKCNMVLVGAKLPENGAMTLTEMLASSHPEMNVLVMGIPQSAAMILQYVIAGASGYVLQDVPIEQLFKNLHAAYEDKALLSPEMTYTLMDKMTELAQLSAQHQLDPAVMAQLTPREREILHLIGEELTNKEIAGQLVIEVGTVKNHVHNILAKLNVNSREDAAAYLTLLDDSVATTPSID